MTQAFNRRSGRAQPGQRGGAPETGHVHACGHAADKEGATLYEKRKNRQKAQKTCFLPVFMQGRPARMRPLPVADRPHRACCLSARNHGKIRGHMRHRGMSYCLSFAYTVVRDMPRRRATQLMLPPHFCTAMTSRSLSCIGRRSIVPAFAAAGAVGHARESLSRIFGGRWLLLMTASPALTTA